MVRLYIRPHLRWKLRSIVLRKSVSRSLLISVHPTRGGSSLMPLVIRRTARHRLRTRIPSPDQKAKSKCHPRCESGGYTAARRGLSTVSPSLSPWVATSVLGLCWMRLSCLLLVRLCPIVNNSVPADRFLRYDGYAVTTCACQSRPNNRLIDSSSQQQLPTCCHHQTSSLPSLSGGAHTSDRLASPSPPTPFVNLSLLSSTTSCSSNSSFNFDVFFRIDLTHLAISPDVTPVQMNVAADPGSSAHRAPSPSSSLQPFPSSVHN